MEIPQEIDPTRDSAAVAGRRRAVVVAWWVLAVCGALLLDGAIARLALPVARVVKHAEVAHELKEVGHFAFVLVLAAFVWILHPASWRGAALLCLNGLTVGLFYTLGKFVVGRVRPIVEIAPYKFAPFADGWWGLINGRNVSFTSGHTLLAFAVATCMGHLLPRGRWAFYTVASLLAAERVAELAHYPSDVVASAGLGILAFHITYYYAEAADRRLAQLLRRGATAASATPLGAA